MFRYLSYASFIFLLATGPGRGAEPFRFTEGKHGKGELKYLSGVPVLVVAGTPEEMGEQMGVLGVKPASGVIDVFKDVLKQHKVDLLMPLLVKFGEAQLAKYPADYRREFEAMVKASGVERNILVIGNTFNELRHLAGCSGLMIDPARSRTGGALLGRNWDFPPIKGLHAFSMVIVRRPEGKRAFAEVSFPGSVAVGCLMASMNADGLVIGGNFIGESADGAPQVDWKNVPSGVIARRIMEECGTLTEGEKLARSVKAGERGAMVACDRTAGAVIEVTPRSVAVRRGKQGICVGTNHFCSPELGVNSQCRRFDILIKAEQMDKLGVDDVAKKMHEANQGAWTAHTMVFEPGPLKLHVAFGDGVKSATTLPLKNLDLAKLLRP
jgi:hypothetical protein